MPFNQLNPYYIYNNNTINAFHNQQHRSFPFQTTSTSHHHHHQQQQQQQQLPMNCRTTITSFKPKVKVSKEQIVPSSIHDTTTLPSSTPSSSSSPPSSNDIINFNTLDELLTYLKNGKQIGNYIKTRNTTLTMINLIKKLPPSELGDLIEMIKPKLKEIMISNNKFCQKLFEQCTAEHRVTIFTAIESHLSEIAFNKWGSYSLQALIKLISLPEEQEIITRFIKGRVYDLSMDKQANFVLQKLILVLNEKCLNPLIDEILLIFNHLIYNPSGVNLLKNVIQINKNVEMKKKLVQKLNENLHNVINNPSSHVIIISIIDKWEYDIVKPLVKDVLKDIVRYSFMKISAGIVLRCISIADAKVMKHVSAVFYKAETLSSFTRSELGKEVLKHILNKLPKKIQDDITTLMLNDVNSDNNNNNTNTVNTNTINTK